jgi:hypothetical protein
MTSREFAEMLEKYAAPFTVMLTITAKENPTANDVINNGTGSLVYTGQKNLLITNHHVYNTFRVCRQTNPHAKLGMSGAHDSLFVDISDIEVLGLDKNLELAVFEMPPQYVFGRGKLFYVPESKSWPPDRPAKGMKGVLIGYPGEGRQPDGGVLGASPLSVGLPIVSVSDRHFVMVDENQDIDIFVPEGQPALTNFGGISGSAVYAMPENLAEPGGKMWLCGFAYEQSQSGAIYAMHADYINADGTIKPSIV